MVFMLQKTFHLVSIVKSTLCIIGHASCEISSLTNLSSYLAAPRVGALCSSACAHPHALINQYALNIHVLNNQTLWCVRLCVCRMCVFVHVYVCVYIAYIAYMLLFRNMFVLEI